MDNPEGPGLFLYHWNGTGTSEARSVFMMFTCLARPYTCKCLVNPSSVREWNFLRPTFLLHMEKQAHEGSVSGEAAVSNLRWMGTDFVLRCNIQLLFLSSSFLSSFLLSVLFSLLSLFWKKYGDHFAVCVCVCVCVCVRVSPYRC
jgi:hypothetical protein